MPNATEQDSLARLDAVEEALGDLGNYVDSMDRGQLQILTNLAKLTLLMECAVNPANETEKRMEALANLRKIGTALFQVAQAMEAEFEDGEDDDSEG